MALRLPKVLARGQAKVPAKVPVSQWSRAGVVKPQPRQNRAKTVADQPPWRLRPFPLHLAQKPLGQRLKSQQQPRQKKVGTKVEIVRGQIHVRQISVVRISVRRRPGLRAGSRTTVATVAATAISPRCLILTRAKRLLTQPVTVT